MNNTVSRIALAAGLTLLAGHEAEAACKFDKIAELHVTVENNQILIPGTLAGKKVKFLFDSNFPASLIPNGAARRLDLPLNSFVQPYFTPVLSGSPNVDDRSVAEVSSFSLDGFEIKDTFFRTFGSPEAYNFGNPDVVALLGSDFWKGYEVEVDLPHKLINLYHTTDCANSNLAYWSSSYNAVDLQRYGSRTVFSLALDGRNLSAVLDTGSPHTLITDKAAARMGLRPENGAAMMADDMEIGSAPTDLPSLLRIGHGLGLDPISPNVQTGGLPAPVQAQPPSAYWMAHFKSLAIDEEVISPISLRVAKESPTRRAETGTLIPTVEPVHYDLLLGVDFLQSHRVMIANSQNRMYFTYTGGSSGFGKQS